MKIMNLLFFLLIAFALKAQIDTKITPEQNKRIDSLVILINSTEKDTIKLNALESLYKIYAKINSDSVTKYVDQSLKVIEGFKSPKEIAHHYDKIADFYWFQNNFPLAKEFYFKELKIDEELLDKTEISKTYCYLGEVFNAEGNYVQAIEYYQKSLRIAEEIGDKMRMMNNYYLIGIVHRRQLNFEQAIEYYLKSFKMAEEIGDKTSMSHCYNSIGIVYRSQKDYTKALEYYQKSLKLKEELKDKKGMAIGYNNIGNIHSLIKNYPKALEYYNRSLKIMEETSNKQGTSMVFGNIACLYDSLKNYNEAIVFAEKSLEIANEISSIDDQRLAQETLHHSYKGLENYKEALKHYELYKSLNDSIYNAEKYKQLTKIEAEYQNEKKQKEIELLKIVSAVESRKQKAIIYSVVSVLLLVLVFALLTQRNYLQKQKANILLAKQKEVIEEKNEKLNQQNEEIAAQRDAVEELNKEVTFQRDEISAQRDNLYIQNKLALEQRDEITRQKKSITDSIAYAKHIQTAMLPNDNEVSQVIPDSFIFFRPLDIVSGDFYWANKINGKSIVAVADCTGHGVPGAFMSIMGINFLNSIVIEQGIEDPGEILTILNRQVIATLSHTDTYLQDKDGMDISLCIIDWLKMEMCYSCAKNRILIIRDGILFQSDANKYSIGKSPLVEKIEFSSDIIPIKKGDVIYLMTDGYVDQFGGPHRTKFLTSKFKKLIAEISNLDINSQKNKLEETIAEWQGNVLQIDDMLIVGLKI
jgi:tetratricopeptide (TPR) repeat protein